MTAKELFSAAAGSPDKLAAVREIIAGPLAREWEQKLAKLSREMDQLREQNEAQRAVYEKKLAQLQAEYADHLKRYARRAGQHRSRLRKKIKEMAAQLDWLVTQLQTDQQNRLTLAKTMAAFARQLRRIPASLPAISAPPGRKKKMRTGLGAVELEPNGQGLTKPAKR